MRRIFCEQIFDVVGNVINNYEGMPRPDDQVANEDRKSIGNADNDFGSAQHGNKLGKMIHPTSGIWQEGGGVPEGIGTWLVGNKCSAGQFPVQRYFVQRL